MQECTLKAAGRRVVSRPSRRSLCQRQSCDERRARTAPCTSPRASRAGHVRACVPAPSSRPQRPALDTQHHSSVHLESRKHPIGGDLLSESAVYSDGITRERAKLIMPKRSEINIKERDLLMTIKFDNELN